MTRDFRYLSEGSCTHCGSTANYWDAFGLQRICTVCRHTRSVQSLQDPGMPAHEPEPEPVPPMEEVIQALQGVLDDADRTPMAAPLVSHAEHQG